MLNRKGENKQKPNTSKLYVLIADVHFLLECIVIGPLLSFLGMDTAITARAIIAAGTICAASRAFYYNKAKAENLSKQRIRYTLMKLSLEDKLSPEAYMEVCEEIEYIDDVFAQKLKGMLEMAVDEETQEMYY